MLLFIFIFSEVIVSNGYIANFFRSTRSFYPLSTISGPADDGISLKNLGSINDDARYLNDCITEWLNKEYIELPIHRKIGTKVSQIYELQRETGIMDLGEILINMGTALESFDMENAFVNAWDVANKASDFLMFRMNRELSLCSGDIQAIVNSLENVKGFPFSTVSIKLSELDESARLLTSTFARYDLMRRLVDSEFIKFTLLYFSLLL